MSKLYEAMFLVDSSKASAQPEQTLDAVRSILTRSGVEILHLDKWDDRKLAYEIQGHKRGTYYLSYFGSDGATNRNIERDCTLSDLVLRVLILRAEHMTLEDVQNVGKQPKRAPRSEDDERSGDRDSDRRDRSDRGDRGDRGSRDRRRPREPEGVDAIDMDA